MPSPNVLCTYNNMNLGNDDTYSMVDSEMLAD